MSQWTECGWVCRIGECTSAGRAMTGAELERSSPGRSSGNGTG